MRKLVTLLTAALLLTGASAYAQGPNTIGVYFDLAGENNCSAAAPYANVNAYLIAKDITVSSGISGWECSVRTEPATLPAGLNVTLANAGLNVLAYPQFQVGLASALPFSPAIVLATMSTFYLGGPVLFGIGPCTPTSFPDAIGPGYAAGDNPGLLTRLVPSSNVPAPFPNTFWVAGIGAGPTCPVATENDSWGGVKSLYQ